MTIGEAMQDVVKATIGVHEYVSIEVAKILHDHIQNLELINEEIVTENYHFKKDILEILNKYKFNIE